MQPADPAIAVDPVAMHKVSRCTCHVTRAVVRSIATDELDNTRVLTHVWRRLLLIDPARMMQASGFCRGTVATGYLQLPYVTVEVHTVLT